MKRRLVLMSVVNAVSGLNIGRARRLLCALIAITAAWLRNSPAFAQLSSGDRVGMQVAAALRYENARAYPALPLPDLSSNSMFLVERPDGDVRFPLRATVAAGVLTAVQRGRKESDATVLDSTRNIATSLKCDAFARRHVGAPSAGIRSPQAAHAGYGNRVSVNASCAVMQKPSAMVAVSGDTVRSDGPSERTYFGIDSTQPGTSDLPAYSPSRGFSRVDVKVSWNHGLNDKWSVRNAVGLGDPVGDAANGPTAQRRPDVFEAAGAAYRFCAAPADWAFIPDARPTHMHG